MNCIFFRDTITNFGKTIRLPYTLPKVYFRQYGLVDDKIEYCTILNIKGIKEIFYFMVLLMHGESLICAVCSVLQLFNYKG